MEGFRQRGEGQIGCIIGLIVLLLAGLVAYKMIPVKVKAAELRQTVVDEAKSAGRRNNDLIRATIMANAEELGLPLKTEDLKIRRKNQEITIEASYVVPIEFPGFTYEWKFSHRAQNPIF